MGNGSNLNKPNIFLIVTDQHSLHAISCYGAPVCRTPNIDGLAEDGIMFTNAYTPCALCTPARASLLSGLYPHNHGAIYNSGTHLPFDEDRIGRGVEIYPQRLIDQGYNIGYVGKWHAGLAKTARDVGFEGFSLRGYGNIWEAEDYKEYLRKRALTMPERVIEFVAEGENVGIGGGNFSGWLKGTIGAAPCHFLADKTIEILEGFSRDSSPFFLTCNFWEPHAPYLPTEDYKDLCDPKEIEPWQSFEDSLSGRPLIHRKYREIVFPGASKAGWDIWSTVVARYWAQVMMIDAEIGRMIDALKGLGLYDNTMIVFTADHGDTVGIHGGAFDKGAMAYQEVYQIPLIVKMPSSAHASTTRDGFVSLIDLADTLCQAVGTKMSRTDGKSLLPLIDDPKHPWRDDFVAEFHGHRIPYGQRIIWWRNFKYILNFADIDELYDLQRDPAEMQNLIWDRSYSDVLAEMRKRMLDNMKKTNDSLGPQAWLFLARPLGK
ncbi:MAG: sulfatase-like hydrolase/transferase [bacterium]